MTPPWLDDARPAGARTWLRRTQPIRRTRRPPRPHCACGTAGSGLAGRREVAALQCIEQCARLLGAGGDADQPSDAFDDLAGGVDEIREVMAMVYPKPRSANGAATPADPGPVRLR